MQVNIKFKTEKRIMQGVIALGCVVPLYGGLEGVLRGVQFLGAGGVDLDSHFRYLSGLLVGVGLAFLSTIPHIEIHSHRFRLLTFIVVLGGFGRLLGFYLIGVPTTSMRFALGMELVVTPLICLWQHFFALRIDFANGRKSQHFRL